MNERERREQLEKLVTLDAKQVQVMYLRCTTGKSVSDITKTLKMANEQTNWTRFTRIFKKLDVSDWTEVESLYCPLFSEFVKTETDWEKWGAIKSEMRREIWKLQSPTETDPSPKQPPKLLVYEPAQSMSAPDLSGLEKDPEERTPTTVNETIKPEKQHSTWPWPVYAIPLFFLGLICVVTTPLAWNALMNAWNNLPTQVPASSSPVAHTQLPVLFTETSPPTHTPTVSMTFTPLTTNTPSLTPTITNTPPPTHTQAPTEIPVITGSIELKPGVYMKLESLDFHDRYCYYTKSGFTADFEIINKSGSDFLIQFDPYDFSAVDDTGFEYTLRAAGVNKCDDDLVPVTYSVPNGGNVSVRVNFFEDYSFGSSHLHVTVNGISNKGPLVFRKDIQ